MRRSLRRQECPAGLPCGISRSIEIVDHEKAQARDTALSERKRPVCSFFSSFLTGVYWSSVSFTLTRLSQSTGPPSARDNSSAMMKDWLKPRAFSRPFRHRHGNDRIEWRPSRAIRRLPRHTHQGILPTSILPPNLKA